MRKYISNKPVGQRIFSELGHNKGGFSSGDMVDQLVLPKIGNLGARPLKPALVIEDPKAFFSSTEVGMMATFHGILSP